MSNENPNFSPLGVLISSIITIILIVSLFFSLPYLPLWIEKGSFLLIALIAVFSGFLATLIAIKQNVIGDLTGIVSSNIGVTIPGLLELGYVFFIKTKFEWKQFVISLFAYFFMIILLLVVVTVSALIGSRIANNLFKPGLKPVE